MTEVFLTMSIGYSGAGTISMVGFSGDLVYFVGEAESLTKLVPFLLMRESCCLIGGSGMFTGAALATPISSNMSSAG